MTDKKGNNNIEIMLCPYNLKHTEMSRIHGGMFEVGDLE
jgi:hypothetical protein